MKVLAGILIGAVIGFIIGYLGHCVSGTCPLTGNPWIASLIGGAFGALVTLK